MLSRANLERLLTWDHWANEAALASIANLAVPPAKAIAWMAHIVGTEYHWLERLRRRTPLVLPWPAWPLGETRERLAALPTAWRAYLEAPSLALDVPLDYVNTKGTAFRNTPADIVTHVVLHSTHHRGQIAALVRESGGEPAVTDFALAVRSGRIE